MSDLSHALLRPPAHEHVLVMSLFIILSLTGLPQKYFDAGWAHWFIDLLGGIDRVRWFHRIAGLSFAAMTAFHLMFAIGAVASGRSPLSIVPNRKDFTDAIQTLHYYLGRADEPARFDRFDYRQKFEYWGLVLGAVVVIVDGADPLFPDPLHPLLPGRAGPGRQGGPQQRRPDGVSRRHPLAHLQRALQP